VSLRIPCPHCGERRFEEFAYGGEVRPLEAADPEEDFARVYLRANPAGVQEERWFHVMGCRRWVTVRRDTVTGWTDRGAPSAGEGAGG
jgi:heterotetrameric sarcosine oxidase delta subunit